MEIIREKRPECAVYKTGDKYLIIRSLALAFHETTGETACCIEFLFVIYLKGKEISTLCYFCCTCYGGQKHSATHLYYC